MLSLTPYLIYNRHLKVRDFTHEFLFSRSQETPDGFVCLDPILDETQMQTDSCSVLLRCGHSQRQGFDHYQKQEHPYPFLQHMVRG